MSKVAGVFGQLDRSKRRSVSQTDQMPSNTEDESPNRKAPTSTCMALTGGFWPGIVTAKTHSLHLTSVAKKELSAEDAVREKRLYQLSFRQELQTNS